MSKLTKTLSLIVAIVILLSLIFVCTLMITDYKPAAVVNLTTENNPSEAIKKNVTFSVSTFNIGYCGMDKGQDFFMDGGKGSRSSSKEETINNLDGITNFLKDQNSDIYFIQEVDEKSTRSFNVNQREHISEEMDGYGKTFAYNYKVLWVPIPVTKPHGNVNCGLFTLSKFNISNSARFDYPGKENWPRQLGDLDRCFIETRTTVEDGKDLVLINSHLSAYDKGGNIRHQQLSFLKEHITNEYEKGNYIIVGGDWNHLMEDTDPTKFDSTESFPDWLQKLPDNFKSSDFEWAVDGTVPSSRTVEFPYEKGKNFLSVIDGFLVSKNVGIEKVTGHNLEFEHTDHNPVTGYFILK
ncbi:endonuclease/exonuclease/phosphatase family protein [Clostridium putrefaciens]|uniref:Endonuclease/exonuclease/phosphatase family protein n=1 Tax=Clostridium putrefaciens TaxID=99675 RepID=A0A381JAX8_9CLOT|nr:endonuclease/exonuclease/phosphatase family protein [Clostridium putrefaciens]SUY47557.1 endonuclease/exonuclease/phosphatase family protein [Clostridium putrefaciens]